MTNIVETQLVESSDWWMCHGLILRADERCHCGASIEFAAKWAQRHAAFYEEIGRIFKPMPDDDIPWWPTE